MSLSWLAASGLALPLLVATAVVLLYLLRPPPRSVMVPSLLLWRRIAERRRTHERLRRLLSTLLSLAVAVALALALAGRTRLPRRGETQLVVVDDTATMAAEVAAGTTRLDLARRRASELIVAWPGPTLLADTTGRSAPRFARTPAEAASWLSELDVSAARGRLPGIARISAKGPPAARRTLVTDGVALEGAEGWVTESVYAPAINVGWIAFAAGSSSRGAAPGDAEAYLEVLNASTSVTATRLVVEDEGGRVLVDRQLELGARESWSGLLDLPATAGRAGARLHARLETPGDALALDDRATSVVAAKRQILVGTVGVAGALERALRLLPGVTVVPIEIEEASDTTPSSTGLDLLVASGWAPLDPPAIPAVLVAPPGRAWLPEPAETLGATVVRVREPGRREWGTLELTGLRRYVMAGGVGSALGDVVLVGERERSAAAGGLAAADELALAFELRSSPAPLLLLAFPIEEAAMVRHEAFPILVAAMIERLTAERITDQVAPAGRPPGAADREAPPLGRRLSDLNASRLPPGPQLATASRSAAPTAPVQSGGSSGRRFALAALLAALAATILETWSRSRGFTE